MKTFFAITLGALLLLSSAVGVWRLHRTTIRLQSRVTELQAASADRDQKSAQEREENRRLVAIVDQAKRGDPATAAAVHAELAKARQKQTELEDRAMALYLTHAERMAEMAKQHDPEQGLVRLEDMPNAGRQTPVTALETVVWAAMKGDAAQLTAGISLSEGARTAVREFLNSLPETSRESYPTPESFAAILVTDEVLKTAALQVMGSTRIDSEHAEVAIRRLETGGQILKLPLQLGEGGWQVVISEKEISQLKQRISGRSP